MKSMTDSAVILAVPLPHMEQILVDARSIRTTSLLTLLGMHRMLWCLCTGEILPSSLPAHQEPFNHYLHLGHFKDADEPHGNYYCSFQVLKYISFQWLSATRDYRINKFQAISMWCSSTKMFLRMCQATIL